MVDIFTWGNSVCGQWLEKEECLWTVDVTD